MVADTSLTGNYLPSPLLVRDTIPGPWFVADFGKEFWIRISSKQMGDFVNVRGLYKIMGTQYKDCMAKGNACLWYLHRDA